MKNLLFCALFVAPLQFAYSQKHTIDKFAEFPGGVEKFYQYVQSNVKYPADARKDSLSGHVYVAFVIDEDGTIKKESIKILKGLSPSCDAEALRVINAAPKWIAASSNTKAVEQAISFPVTFQFK
jgi:TonB family protein